MIYFVQPVEGGLIKIGTTKNFSERRKTLEQKHGVSFVLLAALPGSYEKESELHARFGHLRLDRSEMFSPEPELLEFIHEVLREFPDPIALDEGSPMVSVKIPEDVVRLARIVAGYRNEPISDIIAEACYDTLGEWERLEVEKRSLELATSVHP